MAVENGQGMSGDPTGGGERRLPLSPLEKLIAKLGNENVRLIIDPQTGQLQDIEIDIRLSRLAGTGEEEGPPSEGQ